MKSVFKSCRNLYRNSKGDYCCRSTHVCYDSICCLDPLVVYKNGYIVLVDQPKQLTFNF